MNSTAAKQALSLPSSPPVSTWGSITTLSTRSHNAFLAEHNFLTPKQLAQRIAENAEAQATIDARLKASNHERLLKLQAEERIYIEESVNPNWGEENTPRALPRYGSPFPTYLSKADSARGSKVLDITPMIKHRRFSQGPPRPPYIELVPTELSEDTVFVSFNGTRQ